MRKLTTLVLAVAFTFGLASCSKEAPENGNRENENSAISFSIKTPKGPLVTYSIAKDDENVVNTIDIYVFDKNTKGFIGKLTTTDFTSTSVANTTTINVSKAWVNTHYGKTANFYFVANDPAADSHIGVFSGDEDQFIDLTTKLLTLDGDNKAELMGTPLLFSAVAEGINLTGKVTKTATLRRRIARFDIVNSSPNTLQINSITVSDANIEGYIFDAAALSIPATVAKAGLQTIVGPAVSDYDPIDFLAPAVFYLYPTTLASGKTEIIINATFDGRPENYRVKTNIEIKANMRYKIVADPVSLEFTVVVADYDEGGELEVEPYRNDKVILDNFNTLNATSWLPASRIYTLDDNAGGTFTFDVTSKFGSDYRVVYVTGKEGDMTTPLTVSKTTVTTYAESSVKDTYTVQIPVTALAACNIHLEVFAPYGNASEKEVVKFIKGGFRVGNSIASDPEFIKWLKANIGTNITPVLAKTVTSLTLGSLKIKSFDGIDGLPNLGTLDVLTNSVEVLNLSANTKLKSLSLGFSPLLKEVVISSETQLLDFSIFEAPKLVRVNFHEMDLSQTMAIMMGELPALISPIEDFNLRLSNLKFLVIENVKLMPTIDISGLPLLARFHSRYNYSNITWGNNPNLYDVAFTGKDVKTNIDFGPLPKISLVTIENASLTELDLTKSDQLSRVTIISSESLTKVDISHVPSNQLKFTCTDSGDVEVMVPSTFDVNDPMSMFIQFDITGSTITWTPVP